MSSHDLGAGAGRGTASAKASSGSASDLPPPSTEAQITRLEGERDEARPWMLFYRDGKTLGEIAVECGGSIYDYSPWLTATMTRGALKDAERIIAAEAELKACNRHLSDALAARDEFHAAKRTAEAQITRLEGERDEWKCAHAETVATWDEDKDNWSRALRDAEAKSARLSALLDQAREGNRSSRSEEHSLPSVGRLEARHVAGGGDLSPRLRQALAEVGRFDGKNRVYWWRVKSMADLAVLGLVETYRPPSLANYGGKQLPYRITSAGRCVLQGTPLPAENSADDRSPEGASASLATDEPFLTRLSKTGGEEKQELSPSRTSPSSPDSRRPEALSDLEGVLLAALKELAHRVERAWPSLTVQPNTRQARAAIAKAEARNHD